MRPMWRRSTCRIWNRRRTRSRSKTSCVPTNPVRASIATRCSPPRRRWRITASACPASGEGRHDGDDTSPALSLAADVRSGQRSARETVDEALAAVVAEGDGEINAFLTVLADEARAAADAVDAAVAAGNDPGPLAGVPVALKDNLCTRGAVDDLRFADPGGVAAALRRHRGASAAPRRGDCARQDQHGRVRHGQLDGELGLRADAQPAGHRQGSGRQQRWFGRRRGGRVHPARARLGHGRLHPPAGRPVRGGRDEAHLRSRLAVRVGGLRQLARSDRPVCHDGRGRRAVLRRPGGARPARQHVAAVAARADAARAARRRRGHPGRGLPRPRRRLRARRGGAGATRPRMRWPAPAPRWRRSRCPSSGTGSRPTT